ncbi:hypothetical protein [Corynebacterium efficiens]|uniref:Transmembrane protein n=1 Tax=Corynebacterium efficiens (strain DSM 44549 / YS-314 / AJ 12310 / JCM 11189 / NBRC 100395) TaxID=196164 RepID=Q8FM25_COREF|nr:hypothetical protein [Corynebacterium efficiens]BAC19492.1 conserved hypothetical protein [Corynebacterium efficiens YS-314]
MPPTRKTARQILLWAWVSLLLGSLLWPLAAPGELLLRDMAVVDDPALTLGALGFGDLPSRNAPQDGVLALLALPGLIPVSWVVRVLLVAAGLAGAWGAMQLGRAQFAAVTVALYNPFVVERLLQGHWSLVLAAWLLPLVVALRAHPRAQIVAMWAASLTPTGAVAAAVVAVATSRRRILTAVFALLAWLPWLVPALLSTPTSGGAQAFAVRAEAGVGTIGTVLGLGGIWNAGAVPASRETGFAVAGVVLFVVLLAGVRNCPPVLLGLGAIGLAACLATWALPGFTSWLVVHVPGAGLFRDSQKLLMLAIPAYVSMAAGLNRPLQWAAVVLALLQIPDAPREVQVLRPSSGNTAGLAELAAGRDVLIIGAPTLVLRDDGLPVVDPRAKAVSLVESGELRVDGIITDPPSPRWTAAVDAWSHHDLDRLRELGVGVVIDGDNVVETGAGPQRGWRFHLGLGLTVFWLLLPFGLVFIRRRQR